METRCVLRGSGLSRSDAGAQARRARRRAPGTMDGWMDPLLSGVRCFATSCPELGLVYLGRGTSQRAGDGRESAAVRLSPPTSHSLFLLKRVGASRTRRSPRADRSKTRVPERLWSPGPGSQESAGGGRCVWEPERAGPRGHLPR